MEKKPLIAALIASLLIVSVAVIASGEEAKANVIFPSNLQISVVSPANKTYTSNSVTLNINTSALDSLFEKEKTTQVTYNLDKQGNQSTDSAYFLTTLEELSEDSHVLEVYAQYQYYNPQHYPQGPLTLRAYSIVYFSVDTKTPTPTPTPSWLTIDLADHNYLNNVSVGQPVQFSAEVSNGIAPYRYLWKFRPYHVGTAIGDFYPTGDWIEGPATQNFTFTPNSTGSNLIEVKIWDSTGTEGLFMSLPPGIWVNAKNSTSTSPGASATPNPIDTPSPLTTPSPSTTSSPSPTPTELPTVTPSPSIEPSPTVNKTEDDFTPSTIAVGLVTAVTVVVTLVVLGKRRGKK
jgi:hypothetical protein